MASISGRRRLVRTTFPVHCVSFGTEFTVIDDIDKSLLFLAAVKGGNPDEPFDPRNFHVAAWHEDLTELENKKFIDGIETGTERQWHQVRWKEFYSTIPGGAKIGFKDKQGKFVPINEPSFDVYEDDEEWKPFVVAPSGRIRVTNLGRNFVHTAIESQHPNIASSISEKIRRLFELEFFDTCIREACVQLEHEIKIQIKSDAWGDRLIDEFIRYLQDQRQFLESTVRTLRQELRSIFKLIRNDYMHNLLEADKTTALVILFRISRARTIFTA